jgi:hypothetical protein
LKYAMQSILRDKFGDEEIEFGSGLSSCKTMVLALQPEDIRAAARLRSYTSRSDPVATKCKVWQVALATLANPLWDMPVEIGHPPVQYCSAILGFGNPAKETFHEAVRIWQFPGIDLLVSIGSGKGRAVRLDPQALNLTAMTGILNAMSNAMTDRERVDIDLGRDAKLLDLKYFRFNVESGLEDVASSEWEQRVKVAGKTQIYLRDEAVQARLGLCAGFFLRP